MLSEVNCYYPRTKINHDSFSISPFYISERCEGLCSECSEHTENAKLFPKCLVLSLQALHFYLFIDHSHNLRYIYIAIYSH